MPNALLALMLCKFNKIQSFPLEISDFAKQQIYFGLNSIMKKNFKIQLIESMYLRKIKHVIIAR